MSSTQTTATLPCILSEAEKVEKANELAKALNDHASVEESVAAYKAQKKAELDELWAKVNQLKVIISSGKEHRPVACEWLFRWSKGYKDLVRKDTGEIAQTVAISEQEQQERLPIGEEPQEKGQEKPMQKCALDGCDELFVPKNNGQKYHSKECKKKADSLSRKSRKDKKGE